MQEAERRQITVMFCDLVGSTELSADLDPEELRDLIRAHQAACAEIVKRYEGSVVQYLGDGVLVYFGVPHAHEDDASRAGHAGLEIVRATEALSARWAPKVGRELGVRVGIHTGPVVVGEVGAGERTETLAIGETPNIAARLQAVADPNRVVTSGTTYRLLSRAFHCRDLGLVKLKGVSRSLHAHEIVAPIEAASRLRDVPEAERPALVGRHEQLTLMLDCWRKTRAGTRQTIVVRGEAGIGKSALVDVLKEQVAHDGGMVLEGDCSPYYRNKAFYAVTQALARWIGFRSIDAAADRRLKLESALDALSLTDAAAVPLIGSLLSVPVDVTHPVFQIAAERQRARTVNLLLEIPPALARQRPVLLIIEDLHSADPSTLEFLKAGMSRPEWSNVLVMLTSRPEFTADWFADAGITRMELGGLDAAGAEELVTRTLGGKTLPEAVVRQIVQRTDGVPLFVEETTRTIVESNLLHDAGDHYELAGPLPSTLVPVSLQDALMARLDRLESARGIVQLGATIGREFSYNVVSAVSGAAGPVLSKQLEQAVSSGLLLQRGTLPGATFVFKHALVQETAYQSLLRRTRQQYHQRIADVLEDRFHETAEQQPELLAHHHSEAGNAANAVPYLRSAANQSVARAAFPEAISHLTHALQLLDTLPEAPERDRQELGVQSALGMALQARRGYAAPEVDRAYMRARVLCQRAGTAEDLLAVSRGQSRFYVARADYRTAAELGTELLRVGTDSHSLEHLLEGHLALGVDLIYLGRFVESRAHFEQSVALLAPDTDPPATFQYMGHSSSWSRSYLGRTLSFLGYHGQALAATEEGLAVAQRVAIPLSIAQGMGMQTNLYQLRRDARAAQEWVEKTIAFANEYGFPYWSSLGSMVGGWILGQQGQVEQGIAQLRQGLDRNLATGAKVGSSWFLVMLAELYQINGQWHHGLDAVAQALAHAQETEERYYEAEAYRLKGELLSGQGGTPSTVDAEACFRQAIDVARRQSARIWELRASTSLARLWTRDRPADARQLLTTIYEWFHEGHDVPDLRDARQLLGELTTLD